MLYPRTEKSASRFFIKIREKKRCYQITKAAHISNITTTPQQEVTNYKSSEKPLKLDNELTLLKHTIISGWPSTIKGILPVQQPYWMFHEECTIEYGLILKGTRIVIPSKN